MFRFSAVQSNLLNAFPSSTILSPALFTSMYCILASSLLLHIEYVGALLSPVDQRETIGRVVYCVT